MQWSVIDGWTNAGRTPTWSGPPADSRDTIRIWRAIRCYGDGHRAWRENDRQFRRDPNASWSSKFTLSHRAGGEGRDSVGDSFGSFGKWDRDTADNAALTEWGWGQKLRYRSLKSATGGRMEREAVYAERSLSCAPTEKEWRVWRCHRPQVHVVLLRNWSSFSLMMTKTPQLQQSHPAFS